MSPHHYTFTAENDAMQHCGLSPDPVSGMRRLCSMVYILRHKRACPNGYDNPPRETPQTRMPRVQWAQVALSHLLSLARDRCRTTRPFLCKETFIILSLSRLYLFAIFNYNVLKILPVDILYFMNLSWIRLSFHM